MARRCCVENEPDDESLSNGTPLHVGVMRGLHDMARLLIQRGANHRLRDRHRAFPTDIARRFAVPGMVRLRYVLRLRPFRAYSLSSRLQRE